MMKRRFFPVLVLSGGLALFAGCLSSRVQQPAEAPAPSVEDAARLFEQGRVAQAMIACTQIRRRDPLTPGLAELQHRILRDQAERRNRAAEVRGATTYARAAADVAELNTLPDTYGQRRTLLVDPGAIRTGRSPMQEILNRQVTVHMEAVNLNDFILQIGQSEGVNIIADGQLAEAEATMTLHAEDIPLREVLDYASRNLGVAFSIGHNLIWATVSDTGDTTVPLLTRMYRLRKGMTGTEIEGDSAQMRIIQAIDRFVQKPSGSDLYFDKTAHVLIVKNTRQNLAAVEDIIETLDVSPPQILIEARFISVDVSDLRELGLDWLMTSDYAVTEERYPPGTRTQVDSGASIGFTPFGGTAQGLNLTYRGLLTDPMFEATLHALETSEQARTLSVPKVTTVNNRPASIRVGEDFRFFEEYDVVSVPSAVSDGGSQLYSSVLVPVGTPQMEELGIELSVTPSVGSDMHSITLKLVPEISEFVRYEFYEVGNRGATPTTTPNTGQVGNVQTNNNQTSLLKIPIFRRSRIETEVIVQSGETVVMGGLVTAGESTSQERVPILSAIPLLGRLFRHDIVEKTQDNLLIFVTASIISERGENLIPLAPGSGTPGDASRGRGSPGRPAGAVPEVAAGE